MKLPELKAHEIEAALLRDGWRFVRQSGSHRQFKHPSKPGLVTIPYHSKPIYPQLLRIILRQAGLTPEVFMDLL